MMAIIGFFAVIFAACWLIWQGASMITNLSGWFAPAFGALTMTAGVAIALIAINHAPFTITFRMVQ